MSWNRKSGRNWGRLGMKYELTTLRQICTKIGSGATPRGGKDAYKYSGISLIRSQNVLDFEFSSAGLAFIDETQAEKLNNVEVLENDILLNITGDSVARACKVDKQFLPARVNQHVAIIRPDKSKADADYILYFLQMKKQFLLQISASGGTRNALTKKMIEDLEIDLPILEIQKNIASILSALDDKIALNQQINNNLEQQAQAIFKSWFVDFEPFGSQKPDEWTVSTLGNVSVMSAGGDKPKNVSKIKTKLFPYPIYSNGLSSEGLYGFTDKPKVFEESVTVSARGTIGFVCLRHIPYVPIVRLVTLVPRTEILSAKYLYLWLKQLNITGTGTTQQQLTVPDFQKTEILVPSKKIVEVFTEVVEPIFEKIWANQVENEKLSSLRDILLPKIISGEIDVSELDI